MKKALAFVLFGLMLATPAMCLTIRAYVCWDNTVTWSELTGAVGTARNNIQNQFTNATFMVFYSGTANWSSPTNATSSDQMMTDLLTDFGGYKYPPTYPNSTYHTCIGISKRPSAADPYGNPGYEYYDYVFADYTPQCGFTSVPSLIQHEWGHSLGAYQCTNTSCVMNTTGCKNGKTAYCSTCKSRIRSHMGIPL